MEFDIWVLGRTQKVSYRRHLVVEGQASSWGFTSMGDLPVPVTKGNHRG